LTRNLYKDLADYTGRDPNLVRARCASAAYELAWLWPQYEDNPERCYRETDLYQFDLTDYQQRLRNNGTHTWLRQIVRDHGWSEGLDWGGGIGEWAMILADEGVSMSYHDLYPSKTWDYAAWRFERHRAKVRMIPDDPLGRDWPVVVIMDVLEHLPDPDTLLERLAQRTEYLFCNPDQVPYTWILPQHISEYSPEPWFTQVEHHLWKRN